MTICDSKRKAIKSTKRGDPPEKLNKPRNNDQHGVIIYLRVVHIIYISDSNRAEWRGNTIARQERQSDTRRYKKYPKQIKKNTTENNSEKILCVN